MVNDQGLENRQHGGDCGGYSTCDGCLVHGSDGDIWTAAKPDLGFHLLGVPNWIGSIITVAFTTLWLGLPLLGVVWLLLKIWKSKAPKSSPRITGDSDADLYDEK